MSNFNMSSDVKRLLSFALENNLEIVSFGLAPNPDGFCFEAHACRLTGKEASDDVKRAFSTMLSRLTKQEINQLKKAVF